MPDLKINAEGFLLDAEGNQVLSGDEPIRVVNAQSKERTEEIIKERLARQTSKIQALEKQADKSAETERVLDELRREKERLETELGTARQSAEQEVAVQLDKLNKRSQQLEQELSAERTARVQDQVTNTILKNAGDLFINPGLDIVPKLLPVHKREPVKDASGKVVDGQFLDVFRIAYVNDKGETVEEYLPVEKALEVFASQKGNAHYLRGTGPGGSGGGNYTNVANMKRSEMSVTQKAEFVGKHGVEAFQGLPD